MINDIAESYLKAKEKQTKAHSDYKPTKQWQLVFSQQELLFKELLKNREIFENRLENMLNYEPMYSHMFSIPTANIIDEYIVWKRVIGCGLTEVEPPLVGNPPICTIGYYCSDKQGAILCQDIRITTNSFRYHYFATKIYELLKKVDNPVIIEIGGGYGGLAYYLMKKIKNLTYIGFDLPEHILLSSFYLTRTHPDKKFLLYNKYDTSQDLEEYDAILLPNFELPKLKNDFSDLFLNLRSLSEMNHEQIRTYLIQIERICKNGGYFLHENTYIPLRNKDGFDEIPASAFPVPMIFKVISEGRSPFFGGRYYEYLYRYEKVKISSIMWPKGIK